MENNSPVLSDSHTKKVLRKVNISLSPDNYLSQRINLLPKLQEFKKRKQIKSLRRRSKGSEGSQKISYLGGRLDLTLKSHKIVSIPHFLNVPESLFHLKSDSKSSYFRPKPLTPASLRMHNFSEYKHRLTTGLHRARVSPGPFINC
jgi:hypothetical protein